MEIKTPRLVLRPLGIRDLASTYEYASDPENAKFMVYYPHESIAETEAFLKACDAEWQKSEPDFYEFAILADGTHIGGITLYYFEEDRDTAEFGWIINKKYWKKGYAFEAAQALMKYAKEELGVRHFTASCDSENLPSYRLMEKLGMVKTDYKGTRRNKLSPQEERAELKYELFV